MKLPEGTKITPMLEQYIHWKDKYPDCLLFFRMGDFYEMFFEDAKTASSVLDIVLTSRSKDMDNAIPMAGVPFHAVDSYLGRLVAAGYRVAICEQITEPDGKTLVQRDVTRIVTPGTWLADTNDSDGKICACVIDSKQISVSFLTTGTGTLHAGTFNEEQAVAQIYSFSPDEILLMKGQREQFTSIVGQFTHANIVEREKAEFSVKAASEWLCRKWGVATLNSMGVDDNNPCVGASYAALRYLEETQFSQASHVCSITPILPAENLIIDQNTQNNLELIEPAQTSLFSVLNRCKTVMGRRLLKEWILSPLQDIDEITKRQNSIGALIAERRLSTELGAYLPQCRDMAKSIGRITLNMGSPSDLLAIKLTLDVLPKICELASSSAELSHWMDIGDLTDISVLLDNALSDNVPRFLRDGGVIRAGYDEELDMWRGKAENSARWLAEFEERERAATGIKTLRAGVNKVFGYYIEIPKGSADKAPMNYIRKQTLVNGERYITEELKAFENDMFSAEGRIREIEERLYGELIAKTLSERRHIQSASSFISVIDVLLSLAETASERRYVRPVLDMSTDFDVKCARHPVIEVTLGRHPFTPNDYSFTEASGQRIAIITGPNMAGKSTYLRTAALIAIIAHMGSFVPADSAHIGLVDRVFTRIGARDELARGQSTFMVEMVETANILRHATNRSLVILDEVGRGTSTYDGLSIAWAVLEFLHGQQERQARVLFATHYHELTKLPDFLPGVVNLSMAVEESNDGVTFLHKVVAAPSDRSYGIEVAKLAGIPTVVLKRSRELLGELEKSAAESNANISAEQNQLVLFDAKQEAILEELASADPDSMTPMEALQLVYKLKKESRKALDF
ncbi:MAG: DNA mismatch repair protein MutS [Synergistaceae bacterium]|nr:DNA mismatch repair protein MutS [Synergistaceae bacterium]